MEREKLFKKWDMHPEHEYDMEDTLSYTLEGEEMDIAFVFSGRNRGKSFEVCANLIADAWYDDKTFGYVRRTTPTNFEVEQYFADKTEFISDMTDGLFTTVIVEKGQIKLYGESVDDEGNIKPYKGKRIGYPLSLTKAGKKKSLQFPDMFNMLFEEVMTNEEPYISGEVSRLLNLYSTCKRHKGKDFKLWLISNTVSQVCPYSAEWGLHFSQMKPDEIKLIKLYLGSYDQEGNEEYLIVGCHYLKNKDELTKEDKKKKRLRVRTGIANNSWDELHQYTTVDLSFMKQFKIEETVVFEYDDIMIQGNIVIVPTNLIQCYLDEEVEPVKEEMPILYMRKKTSEPHYFTRLYTNNVERFGEYITKGYVLYYKIDKAVDTLLKTGWVIGADNITMNNFNQILTQLQYLKSGF